MARIKERARPTPPNITPHGKLSVEGGRRASPSYDAGLFLNTETHTHLSLGAGMEREEDWESRACLSWLLWFVLGLWFPLIYFFRVFIFYFLFWFTLACFLPGGAFYNIDGFAARRASGNGILLHPAVRPRSTPDSYQEISFDVLL